MAPTGILADPSVYTNTEPPLTSSPMPTLPPSRGHARDSRIVAQPDSQDPERRAHGIMPVRVSHGHLFTGGGTQFDQGEVEPLDARHGTRMDRSEGSACAILGSAVRGTVCSHSALRVFGMQSDVSNDVSLRCIHGRGYSLGIWRG